MPASTKTYSYDAGTTTASAKGGSMRDPITLANMDADATIGGHISTSGEASRPTPATATWSWAPRTRTRSSASRKTRR
ncbi:MAG: hypothetical protein JW759_00205 [Candidatus Coatesbacteria bacterium]|nr:hypothetical protein [Candidatus Coatesbacteria bacterium]